MSEMVEHCGAAIDGAVLTNSVTGEQMTFRQLFEGLAAEMGTPWDEATWSTQTSELARAVLKAMLYPNAAMMEAGAIEIRASVFYSDDGKMAAEDVWTAMVEEALKD